MTDMTPAQIRSALSAGIINQEQANAMLLKTGAAPLNDDAAVIGNEDEMRFVRGFSDIFIAMGMGLLVLGLSIFATTMGGVGFLGAAALMFGLAEYFGRYKRQHLPTLVTAVGFLIFINIGVGMVMGTDRISTEGNIIAAVIGLAAMIVFYVRIKLPFCMALIALSVVYLFFSVMMTMIDDTNLFVVGLLLLVSGMAILIYALRYDLRDPERLTRYADNAFWLHLVSAPLIIHGLVVMLVGQTYDISNTTASIVLGIVILVSLFGLAINRRALLVSSLGYAGLGIGYLVSQTNISWGMAISVTLMILGAAVVFLGAGWNPARKFILALLPSAKIFPPAQ